MEGKEEEENEGPVLIPSTRAGKMPPDRVWASHNAAFLGSKGLPKEGALPLPGPWKALAPTLAPLEEEGATSDACSK